MLHSTSCMLTLVQPAVELGKLQELLSPVRELPPSFPKMALDVCGKHLTPSNVNIGCLNPTVQLTSDMPEVCSFTATAVQPCSVHKAGQALHPRRCPVPCSTQGLLVQQGLTSRKASKLITFMVVAFLV